MRRSSKLPKDVNQRAAEIVRLSTEKTEPQAERSPISEYLAKIGSKGGKKGGPARAKKLSPTKRKQIAQKAGRSRWGRDRT